MLVLACLFAVAAAAPATYDQRQDGDFNVRADVQNVVLVVAYPQKMSGVPMWLQGLMKSSGKNGLQERSDFHVMEAFVEPNTPYHVEIGESSRHAEGDGRAVEVVIAGRRRLETEPEHEQDEYKLLGATEQCGPDRERDPVTLTCRAIQQSSDQDADTPKQTNKQPEQTSHADEQVKKLAGNPSPEVIPASS